MPSDDLLADVFEGTEDAPLPLCSRDAGGSLIKLHASPKDPRWSVDVLLHPNGDVWNVRAVQFREQEAS